MEIKIVPGQIWIYKTRKHERDSRVIVVDIEDRPNESQIVHIKINNLKIKRKQTGQVILDSIEHLPICRDMFEKSVSALDGFIEVKENEGYSYWKSAYKNGKAGIWNVEIAAAISLTEETLEL